MVSVKDPWWFISRGAAESAEAQDRKNVIAEVVTNYKKCVGMYGGS
jgi:hypothetical protein